MRRLPFRRVLPVVQLALFIALMLMGRAEEKADSALWDAMRSAHGPATGIAQSEGWDDVVHVWDPYIPASWQAAFAINLPALLLAVPVALPLDWLMQTSSPRPSWPFWVLFSAAVLVFWRLVGVWLDRRRHLLPSTPRRLPAAVLKGVAYVGGAALVAFGLYIGVATFMTIPRFYLITKLGVIVWSLLLGVIFLREPRRRRNLARVAASSAGS